MQALYTHLKKLIVFIVGLTIIIIGIALLVLPGPGLVTIAVGLGVLSLEFVWAKHLFKKMKAYSKDQLDSLQNKLDKKNKP
ncbi:MAG TPA: PGPGW domain-containing protein [Oligoflexia bacterium]|nr:PGPGW domain-containing protein [Oligoflexia bacterium]HMR25651.1 PGPGW domain-containing protein [Oligoflexia bacterium]